MSSTQSGQKTEYLLEMRGICKEFVGVKALNNVDFCIRPGTVHTLIGENGAGKSTLAKCLFGIYRKDGGKISLKGEEVDSQTPHDALLHGVSIVHQELEQVHDRNVVENVWLGYLPLKHGLIDTKEMYEDTKTALNSLGEEMVPDPAEKLLNLTVSKKQLVDIAKAISYNCDIITLDKLTSSLNEKEVETLMGIIKGLKEQGEGIIYISHKTEEISWIVDDITVMWDGQLISTDRASDINIGIVIKEMVGRELTNRFPEKTGHIEKEILTIQGLNDEKQHIHDIPFHLKEGEVLGIAGLSGAGRTELLEVLFGLRRSAAGEIKLGGKEVCSRNAGEVIRNRFALCTEERRFSGMLPDLNVSFNTVILQIKSYTNCFGWFQMKKIDVDTKHMIDVMRTKTPDIKTKIHYLSGGNQQKVIIGRWLLHNPDIFLMDDPARGIDVGAKYEIYQLIFELAKEGKGAIVCSSGVPEFLGVCDRILVLNSGYLTGEYDLKKDPERTTQENIMRDAIKFV